MRILFVDHAYHKATKSSAFFVELLRRSFEVDVFRYDRCYRVSIPREKIDRADVIVYWEFLPSRFRIAEPGKRCVFVPMYDNEWGSRWQWKRIADSGMAVVSFCGRVTEHARKCGVKNLLDIRYALPPSPAPGDPRVAVLWDRGQVGIDHVRKLFAPGDLDKLIVVRRPSKGKPPEPIPDEIRKAYHVELHEGGYLPDEEYRALLAEPGVYIAPRFTEGIGLSFLEALAAGKFVVAHKDATMDEAVEDGVNGRLVDMRNPPRVDLPATAPATRLAKAEERYARWKKDEERILAFFAALGDRPLCPSPWTIRSVFGYAGFIIEGLKMRLKTKQPSTDKGTVSPGRKCLRFLLEVGRFINRNLLRSSWIARHIPFRDALYRILAPSLNKEEIARMPQNFRCDIIEKKVAAAVLKNEDQTIRFVILLVQSLGDIVSCEPICRHLKTLAPKSRITWVVKPKYADVLAAFPLVDEVLEVESISRGFDLCSELEAKNGAIVVNCHFDKSFCPESKRVLRNPCNPSVNADTYYAIGNLLETFCLKAGLPRLKEAPSLDLGRCVCNLPDYLPPHFAVFHCHSADATRDWTDDNWNALADWMFKRGIPVVEVGFPKTILSYSPLYVDMTGRRNALDVAAAIQRSDLFVGVDSGFAHFANAFQIPSVVLLGRFMVFDQYFPYSGPFAHSHSFQCVRAPLGKFAKTIELDCVEAAIQQLRTIS